jgi:hypothetical protein
MLLNSVRPRPLAFVLGTLVASLSLTANAETIVDVPNKIEALGLGIYAPLDGGNGKIEGSEKEGDKRGGNGAIVMSLKKCTTGEDNRCQLSRSAVAYDIGDQKKTKLSGLGIISYDYYTDDLQGKDTAFKFYCNNNTLITANHDAQVTGNWTTRTVDLETATFYRSIKNADGIYEPRTQTLAEWANDDDWCSGRTSKVTAMQIGAGDKEGIGADAQVYLDYLDFGAAMGRAGNADKPKPGDVFNFEFPAVESPPTVETIIVDSADDGWAIAGWSNPLPRPIVGIADKNGGATTSLDLSLGGGIEGGQVAVTLTPEKFPDGIQVLGDLKSLSWWAHHDREFGYPKVSILLNCPKDGACGTSGKENIYFSPRNQALVENVWGKVEVDFDGNVFRNNGGLGVNGEPVDLTLDQWIQEYPNAEIRRIQWTYGWSGGTTPPEGIVSYIDHLEINSTTYDFAFAPPPAPKRPKNLKATPGDESVSVAFTPNGDNGTAITDYECRLDIVGGDRGEFFSCGRAVSPSISSPERVDLTGLDNGIDYNLRLRAVNLEGVPSGKSDVMFAPRAPATSDDVTVNSPDQGFYLSGWTSSYAQTRDPAGGEYEAPGTASLNAGLAGEGGDRWGLMIKPESISERKVTRLYDLTSLSFRYQTDEVRNYPRLGIALVGNGDLGNGLVEEDVIQLNAPMDKAPETTPGTWNTFTVDFDETVFKRASDGHLLTLQEWIDIKGSREIVLFRWQTGNGNEQIATTQETYIDFIEINGLTHNFEVETLEVLPDAPTITGVTPGDSSAVVEFTAGADNGTTINRYEYQVNQEGWVKSTNGTASPITITGLTNGVTVDIKIKAFASTNSAGNLESLPSSTVSVTPAGVPLPPTALSASGGDQLAVVDFNAAGTDNGTEISNYQVSVNGAGYVALSPAQTSSPVTVTGLTNGQTSTISLKTVTSMGVSAASDAVSVALSPPSSGGGSPEPEATVPGAPVIGSITTSDAGSATIAFTAGSSNGADISNYQYRLNDGDWVARTPASSASPLILEGLAIGSAYEVSLRAVNTKGAGASSGAGRFSLAQKQMIVEADTGGGTLTLAIETVAGSSCSINADSVALSPVPAVQANVTRSYVNMLNFSLERCATGESVDVSITLSDDAPAGSVPYKYTDGQWSVIEGATLTGKVIRYTLVDGGPLDESSIPGQIDDPATVAVPSGKPEAPDDLSATAGNGEATVSFTPGGDGGSALINYLYSVDDVNYVALDPADTTSPITITNLTNGEGVSITLKARNSQGDSPASEPVVVVPVAPAAPVVPVPLPLWLFAMLTGLISWLGYQRLKLL